MSFSIDDLADLIIRLKKGSPNAFDVFYENYYPFVYRISLSLTNNHSDAEDLSHDVILEAVLKIEQYNPNRGSIEAWLAVKTRSRCMDFLRKKQRDQNKRMTVEDPSVLPTTEEIVLSKVEEKLIHHALNQIPEQQKEVIIGKFFEEKTQQELANSLKKPLGTIKSLIRYGLNNIKKQLDAMGWMEVSGGAKKHE